jgi:hypothetical protein
MVTGQIKAKSHTIILYKFEDKPVSKDINILVKNHIGFNNELYHLIDQEY